MKAIITIRDEIPPHKILADVSGSRVDRLLTRTGRGRFAFNTLPGTPPTDLATFREGRIVEIASTTRIATYTGVITQTQTTAGGLLEVSGDNYSSVLYNPGLPASLRASNIDAGYWARQLLRYAQLGGRSVFVEAGVLRGSRLSSREAVEFGAQTLGSALDRLAKTVDDEWWIYPESSRARLRHRLYWRHRRGVDVSATVYLEEGRDFSAARYKRDGLGMIRSSIAVGGGGPVGERNSVGISSRFAALGKLAQQAIKVPASDRARPLLDRDLYLYRATESDRTVLHDAARRAYTRPVTAAESLAVTVTSRQWPVLNVGDWITMRFHSFGTTGLIRRVRIDAMQPDEDAGECDMAVSL